MAEIEDITTTEKDPLIDLQKASHLDEKCIGFLSSISHEIRTPLNSAIGFTSLLAKTNLSEQQTQFLNYIKTSNEIISRLTNDIIDFSRIQSGDIQLTSIDIDIRTIVREVFSMTNVLAFKQNVILTYAIDEKLEDTVIGDPVRLKQVLLNLMSTALKYCEKRPAASDRRVKLEVGVQYTDNSNITATFSIKTEKDAFENSSAIKNCEFNLILSNMLVELMNKKYAGGSVENKAITISRDSEECLRLSFQLFFKTGKSFLQTAEENRRNVRRDHNAPRRKYRILIVDDDPVSLELTRIVLNSNGHSVSLAANGLEAVEAAGKNTFDIILMDSHMPVLNGFEATARIRKNGFINPIIALTASAMNEDREACISAGMSSFISKPIDPDSISSAIDDFMDHHTGQDGEGQTPGTVKNFESSVSRGSKIFNNDLFYRNVSGKPRIAKEITRIFFESYHKFMAEIRDAVLNSDSEALWKTAHRMKGTSINVGAETMSSLFSQLEEFGRKNYISGYQHFLNSIIDEISTEYEKYRFEILSNPMLAQTENEF